MTLPWLALVNPAAGGGKCGREAAAALEGLRKRGVAIDEAVTARPGHAVALARDGYRSGYRRFVAVGGDGTSHEIVNGLFPLPAGAERPSLAFLPLGTGNSFLRDFSDRGAEHAAGALVAGRERPCDVLRLVHAGGLLHSINLLCLGFPADVAAVTNRRFKRLGEFGYLLGILACLARMKRRAFPHRVDGSAETDAGRCLFLSFNNSKYTGGRMMIAPRAETSDGLVEIVRWGPIGRLALLRRLRGLFDGSHIDHPLARRRAARRVDFALEGPVDVMVDGEVVALHCRSLEVLPSALTVVA
ncbi:MAG: diacylglycerol/lipid kinase family protein [Planctomycetota bacterium]